MSGQGTQPLVAIHDSELTRALESKPAISPTPIGTNTTGFEWWTKDWHYFVMPESLKEALRSDGTSFTVIGDSNIVAGVLLTNGAPKYPILISLASEAIRDDQIAAFTNYVAAGGFLLVGSSAFTRNTNGTTRGDFAFANQLGLHMVSASLTNWGTNSTFTKRAEHRLISHIPGGQLTWRMPTSADEVPWGISPDHPFLGPHGLWQVQVSDATVLAQGDIYPLLSVKKYGKGYFIYCAAFQPLIGHNGFAPSMYAYVIFRQAIEWAFETANLPVPRISPWPYQYDAAMMVRHDLENFTNEIAGIESSARFEFTNGAWGDYFFCTGTLREDASPSYDTNLITAGLRNAVTTYGASIGPHNGGLKNPNNPSLIRGQYDYWHWGPDEALDAAPTNFLNGKAYALTSLSNAFGDIESWLSGITNGLRIWAGCYFNATREDSYDIQAQLGVNIAGDQKLTPFPHWTLSTRTPGKRYSFLSEPVSDWFANGLVAQSLEPWHPPGVHTIRTLHEGIDFYYNLGALVSFYSHTLSTGLGDAGQLASEYVTYSMNTNVHPRLWSTNAAGVYYWWLQRSNVQISAVHSTNATQSILNYAVTGSTNANLAIDALVPASGSAFGLQVLTNGVAAGTTSYRTNGQLIRVRVGTAITNIQVKYVLGPKAQNDSYNLQTGATLNLAAPGVLVNDGFGAATNVTAVLITGTAHGALILNPNGSFSYSPAAGFTGADSFIYQARDSQGNASSATVSITVRPINILLAEDFTRGTDPAPLLPWIAQSGNWDITGGVLKGATNMLQIYSFAFLTNSWANYSVQARLQFPGEAFGGGLSGRVNPSTGARYTAWIYPENSSGGSNVLRLIKFQSWNTFGYGNVGSVPMAQVNLPGVGTNWHTLKLAFLDNRIGVYFDGTLVLSVLDEEAQPYLSGSLSADMWTDLVPYSLSVDDVVVSPLVGQDGYSVNEDTLLSVSGPGVLGNDTGVNGTNLAAVVVTGPGHGVLNLGAEGGFTYQPATNYSGPDSFTYQVSDGPVSLGSATVNIVVSPLSDAPLLPVQVDRTIAEQSPLVVTNTATDPDSPPQSLNYVLVTAPAGTVMTTNGVITWTPSEAQGPSTNVITTVVNKGSNPVLSATNSFVVVVTEINTAPVLPTQVNRTIASLATLVITNTATDADFPTNTLNYTIQSLLPGVSITTNGIITWTPTQAQDPSTNIITTVVTDANLLAVNSQHLSKTNSFTVVVGSRPVVTLDSTALIVEACTPTNNVIDSGETVTLLFALKNTGSGDTTNLVVTLLPTNGVALPSGPQFYGLLTAGGPAASLPFTFSATGMCGSTITATLSMQDGNFNLGTAVATFQLGQIVTILTQSFDTVIAPALPTGWTSSASGAQALWRTTNSLADSAPNTAFSIDAGAVGVNELVSPQVVLPLAQSQLTFRHRFSFESGVGTNAFDGGVLEIKIGTNVFMDILLAGGTFASNGYTGTIDGRYANPLAGRQAWSATNNSYITSVVNLPASATGKTIQLRWRCGTDASNGGGGWRVDTIGIHATVCCANGSPVLPAQSSRTVAELFTLTVTNTATDNPADVLTYSLVNPPFGAAISTNGIITWTPSEEQGPITNTITTIVFDNGTPPLSATNSIVVVVTEVNTAPILPLQNQMSVTELSTLVVTNTGIDLDIPVNTLAYALIDAPAGALIDANGIITWTPMESQGPGTNTITTVVTDSGVPPKSATNSFTVVVLDTHTIPVLPAQSDQTILEQTTLWVTNRVLGSVSQTSSLSYTLLNAPLGAIIDTNGVIMWTPTESQGPSTNTITTMVANHEVPPLSSTNSFKVTVTEANTTPTLPPQSNRTVEENSALVVTNTASDSDIPINKLTYSLIDAPSGAVIDTNGVITWTPGETQGPGTNLITTVVTDDGAPSLRATNMFYVFVTEVNGAPALSIQPDRTVAELTEMVVINKASDSDFPDNTFTYQLIEAPLGLSIDQSGVIRWTPSEIQGPSTNTVTTIVTDNGIPRLSATNHFQVFVVEVNSAPVLPLQNNRTIQALTQMVVTNTATDGDIPANVIAYVLTNAPAGAQIDADGVITWTPDVEHALGSYVFTTVVSDGGFPSLTATNSFEVMVQDTPTPPKIVSISFVEGSAVVIWTSIPGHTYRLEHKNDPADSEWLPVGLDLPATEDTLTATDNLGAAEQRFYRVVLLP